MEYLLVHTYESGVSFYLIECDFPLGENLAGMVKQGADGKALIEQLAELLNIGFVPEAGEDMAIIAAPIRHTLTYAQFNALPVKRQD